MKLWTIQHRTAYDKLMKTGFLRADENHLFCEDDLRFAYDWMAEEMKKRIGNPPDKIQYPVWLWYQWEGCRKRPDMRSFGRRWAAKGTPITLITAEIPDHKVLLSDFDMWHIVLNNAYLALTEEEDEHPVLTKEKSWERIFDFSIDNEYWNLKGSRSIQATVWEVVKEQVCKAEHFIAR